MGSAAAFCHQTQPAWRAAQSPDGAEGHPVPNPAPAQRRQAGEPWKKNTGVAPMMPADQRKFCANVLETGKGQMTDKTAIQRQHMRRRDLLALIGVASGAATMVQSMTALGFVAESPYKGPVRLDGDPKSASVLILGAGLAGMVAAYELRKAGYKLQILEYNDRAGGRSWTIRGGDAYTELGGFTQKCAFDRGLYFNPGPWRIPYHHRAILDYCKRLGVALEPFVQVNHNAYVHSEDALDGRPQRFRYVQADFNGAIA